MVSESLPKPARKKPATSARKKKSGKAGTGRWRLEKPTALQNILLLLTEILALLWVAWVVGVALLGYAASWFTGGEAETHLLPFAGTVLGLALSASLIIRGWLWMRTRLKTRSCWLPAIVAVTLTAMATGFAAQPTFRIQQGHLKTLIGGMHEAERTTLAHQVYAAYRRADLNDIRRILDRALVYWPIVREAADAYQLDPEVLVGVGAADGGDDVGLGSPVDFGDVVVATFARHFERVQPIEATNDQVGRATRGAHGDVE